MAGIAPLDSLPAGPPTERASLLPQGNLRQYDVETPEPKHLVTCPTNPPESPSVYSNKTFWILFVILLTLNTGYAMVLPGLLPYFEKVGGKRTEYGFIAASYSFGQFAGSLAFGFMADRFAPFWVLELALLFVVTGSLIFATADTLPVLYTGRVLWGVGGGAAPVLIAACARLCRPKERARAVGVFNLGGTMGYIIGPGLAALVSYIKFDIADGYEFNTYTGPGYITSAIASACGVVIYFTDSIPKPVKVGSTGAEQARDWGRLPLMALHWWNNFTFFSVLAASEVIATPFSMDWYGWTVRDISFFWLANSGIGMSIYLIIFFKGRSLYPCTVVFASASLQVIAILMTIHFDDWETAISPLRFIISSALTGTVLTSGIALNVGTVAAISPPAIQGTVIGVLNGVGSVARAAAPIWSVHIYFHYNPNVYYSIGANLMVTAFFGSGFLLYKELPIFKEMIRAMRPIEASARAPSNNSRPHGTTPKITGKDKGIN